MFARLSQKFADAHTLKLLLESAERIANAAGQQQPGAEHVLLAALELPDGTAAAALHKLGVTAASFKQALLEQQVAALASVGVTATPAQLESAPVPQTSGMYQAQASAQSLIQRLALHKRARPLQSADVLQAALAAQHGTVLRAFAALGVSVEDVVTAAA